MTDYDFFMERLFWVLMSIAFIGMIVILLYIWLR